MKAFRVFYEFRGVGQFAVISAPDAKTAEATFRHNHRGCTVERVEPMTPSSTPASPRPRPPARAGVRASLLPPEVQEHLVSQARQLTAELRAHINALP